MCGYVEVHGFIFITWEQFLCAHYGEILLSLYMDAIAKQGKVTCVYADDVFFRGVKAVADCAKCSPATLLEEYSRFMGDTP